MTLWAWCRLEAQVEADEGLASAGDTLKGQTGRVRISPRSALSITPPLLRKAFSMVMFSGAYPAFALRAEPLRVSSLTRFNRGYVCQ